MLSFAVKIMVERSSVRRQNSVANGVGNAVSVRHLRRGLLSTTYISAVVTFEPNITVPTYTDLHLCGFEPYGFIFMFVGCVFNFSFLAFLADITHMSAPESANTVIGCSLIITSVVYLFCCTTFRTAFLLTPAILRTLGSLEYTRLVSFSPEDSSLSD